MKPSPEVGRVVGYPLGFDTGQKGTALLVKVALIGLVKAPLTVKETLPALPNTGISISIAFQLISMK